MLMLWFLVFGFGMKLLYCKASQNIPDNQIRNQAAYDDDVVVHDDHDDHSEDHGDKVLMWIESGSSTLDCLPIYQQRL